MSNNNESKIIKFLNGKVFYVVLCVCFIGIGVAAWAGVQGVKRQNSLENQKGNNSLTAKLPDVGSDDSSSATLPQEPDSSTGNSSSTDSDNNVTDTPDDNKAADDDSDAETTDSPVAAFFIKPVTGETLKDFSDLELQYSMTYGDMRLHKALDILAEAGTPVTACGDGTVKDVYADPLLGSTVEIDHGKGIIVKYCGLNSTPTVAKGDTVDSSTQIGTVDVIPSESVEPRHIHIEFYLNGKAVSPSKYFTSN